MNTHRPCFYFALAMALGILLGHSSLLSWMEWSILCGFWMILSLMQSRLSIVFLFLSIVCLGALFEQSSYIYPKEHIAFLPFSDQKKVTELEGVIDSDVQIKPTLYGLKKVFEFRLSRLKMEGRWQSTKGRILVNCFKPIDLNYGDQLRVEGSLFKSKQNPKERFSYQQYLEDHGLFFILSVAKKRNIEILSVHEGSWWMEISLQIRHRFKQVLEKYLEPQEVSMIQAMTLGDRSFLSKDMYALFSKTGTSHILAISGMNMAIIGAMVLFLLKAIGLPRRFQLILTAVFLLCYALVCGFSASVVRSVLMAAVVLSSFCLEYEGEGLNSLGFAALILFLLNPNNLFDIGFQLSFICVLMIISIYPLFQAFIDQRIKVMFFRYIAQAFCISLIAWVGVTPLIAYHFEIVSFISILANIPIVFLADLVIILSLGLVVLGLFCTPLALAFAGCLKGVFNLMLILIFNFAQIPGAYVYVHQINLGYVLIYYGILDVILSYFILKKH